MSKRTTPPEDPQEPVGDDYSEPDYVEPQAAPEAPVDPLAVPPPDLDEFAPYDVNEVLRPLAFANGEEDKKEFVLGDLVDDEGNPLPKFDDRYVEDLYGLLHVGALTKKFAWLGHRFLIRTMTVEETLFVARLTEEYTGTAGDGLAYRTAVAAMCVQQIDGKDLPIPIGEADDYAYAQQRFAFAKRFFMFTTEKIFTEYLDLELRTRQVVDAMGKAYGHPALVASTPG